MDKFDFITSRLDELSRANLFRRMVRIDSAQGTTVRIDAHDKAVFCSNNYLGLANDPRVIEVVIQTIREYGHGAGASRLLCGTMMPHTELEDAFAALFRKEAALIFPSGWTANEALIKTLPERGDLLLLDKLDHASIIDAAKAGAADFRTYRRENPDRLEELLAAQPDRRKFIVTESIFSMDGDAADLKTLAELRNKYGAILIVDEAHALGCIGKTGAGLAEQSDVLEDIDIIVATMSKALGSAGGVVAGPKAVIDLLVNKARSFIYTTAPTVANCAAALAAIKILSEEPERRERLTKNAEYLRSSLKHLGIDAGRSTSHIIPVIIGQEEAALTVSQRLYEMGYFIPAIRPPTVAAGTARLRISVQSEHQKEQLDGLCGALEKLMAESLLPTSHP